MELNPLCAKKQKTFPVKSWKNCPIVNFKVIPLRKEKIFPRKLMFIFGRPSFNRARFLFRMCGFLVCLCALYFAENIMLS
jgi:hypothetical protein